MCTPVNAMVVGSFDGGACPMGNQTCYPQSVNSFTPNWTPGSGAHQGVCTQQQSSDFFTDCIGAGSSQALCSAWLGIAANMPCFTCLYTDSTTNPSSYGALIGFPNSTSLNLAGCIALAEPCNLQCGKDVQAADQCSHVACDSACPVMNGNMQQFSAWETCVNEAESQCGCEAYGAAASSCETQLDVAGHDAFSYCFAGENLAQAPPTFFQDAYGSIAAFMCGN
jgi:hypothetical protein